MPSLSDSIAGPSGLAFGHFDHMEVNMDIANINRVIEAVKASPKAYKMTYWVNFAKYNVSFDTLNAMANGDTCGTAACIGGWMNVLALRDKAAGDERYANINAGENSAMVATFLGIPVDEYSLEVGRSLSSLFNMVSSEPHVWLSMPRFDELAPEDRARAGVRALEIWRDTGKADWPRALRETGLYDQVARKVAD